MPEIYTSSKFGYGFGDIWMSNLSCSGNETDVSSCRFNGWGHSGCKHDKDVGISCGNRIRAHTHIFGVFNFKTRTFLFAFINEYFNQIGNTMKVYLSSTRDVLH